MPKALAKPKSASFSSPFLLIRRFCGFRSLQSKGWDANKVKTHEINLWSTLCVWQKFNPLRSWNIRLFTMSPSISPFKESKYFFKSCQKKHIESGKAPKKSLMSCSPGHNVQIQAWVSSQSEEHREERQCWGASTPAIKSCLNQQFWSESLRPHLKQTNLSQSGTRHPLIVVV